MLVYFSVYAQKLRYIKRGCISRRKTTKTSENNKKTKIIEKLLLGLIVISIYVYNCKKKRHSVKTPLPNKRHK